MKTTKKLNDLISSAKTINWKEGMIIGAELGAVIAISKSFGSECTPTLDGIIANSTILGKGGLVGLLYGLSNQKANQIYYTTTNYLEKIRSYLVIKKCISP